VSSGACAVMGCLPCVMRVLELSEGSMLETVEGFLCVPWHGDVHGVVYVVPCHVHSQVERAGPVCDDNVELFEGC
jgi:hypothetical protein